MQDYLNNRIQKKKYTRSKLGGTRLCSMLILLASLMSFVKEGRAQSMSWKDALLQQIASLQVIKDSFYYAGTFPTERRYGRSEKLKADNNIFFTGLIAFTLKELRPLLEPAQQAICDHIVNKARAAYVHFQNAQGRPTYNFWSVQPPEIFPNSPFLNHFNSAQALPDDLDDTAILWLSMDGSDSLMREVKRLMDLHSNLQQNRIRNTFKRYRDMAAYSTWFGEKMPIDFDFCVLTNVLYFVHHYNLPLDRHDFATVDLLKAMILDNAYIRHAEYISPHYGRTPLLLYHISRLLGKYTIPALDSLKPQLLQEAQLGYASADNWLDSTLLSTAIMRLGGSPKPVAKPDDQDLNQTFHSFFVASFAAILTEPWKKVLVHSQFIKYYFVCPAYRAVLYLENRMLNENYRADMAGQSKVLPRNFGVGP